MSRRGNNDRSRSMRRSEIRQNRLQMPLVFGTPNLNATLSHVHATSDITSGVFLRERLGSGSASVGVFLRGDGTWAEVTGGPGGTVTYAHAHSAGDITSGILDPARLGSGTATSTTYLRGDGVWATVSGSADGSHSSHQTLSDLQGGTASEYYHLTSLQWAGVVASGWASATHTHAYEVLYAPLDHTHSYSAIYASTAHVHAASDITSGIFARERLGSLSATQNTFLRGTGEWTDIGWASLTHTHAYEALYAAIDHTHSYSAIYASAAHEHAYLPLAGGTVTGTTTFNRTVWIDTEANSLGAFLALRGLASAVSGILYYGSQYLRAGAFWNGVAGEYAINVYDPSGSAAQKAFSAEYNGRAALYYQGAAQIRTQPNGIYFGPNAAGPCSITTGGDPEGSVSATIGSVHFRTDTLPSMYTKTSGAGSTGWEPLALQSHTHSAGVITNGTIAPARLGSGTTDSTTFLRGDSTWVTVAAGTEYITKVDTATGSCGAYLTWQRMNANSSAISDISGVVVMSTLGVGTGTWAVKYNVLYQSSVAGNGIGLYLRHTGTVGTFASQWTFVSTGGTAATGIADQAAATSAGQLVEGKAERANNTCSSPTTGVDTNAADMLGVMDAVIVVTASGDLQLKARSETAGGTVTVMANTCLQLSKIA